jgi:biotin transport system substrate-specific component
MARLAIQTLTIPQSRARDGALEVSRQVAIVVGASLLVALCARIYIPLPHTPVPLTVQNLGVLLVGLTLGSRRGFAALVLYLVEGMVGLPVFSPTGLGGAAQLFGITGGFLLVYPFVAFFAGYIFERGTKKFPRAAVAGFLAEVLLFAGGLTWLYIFTHSLTKAAYLGLYWFLAAEVIKVMLAAAIATRWRGSAARNAGQH